MSDTKRKFERLLGGVLARFHPHAWAWRVADRQPRASLETTPPFRTSPPSTEKKARNEWSVGIRQIPSRHENSNNSFLIVNLCEKKTEQRWNVPLNDETIFALSVVDIPLEDLPSKPWSKLVSKQSLLCFWNNLLHFLLLSFVLPSVKFLWTFLFTFKNIINLKITFLYFATKLY